TPKPGTRGWGSRLVECAGIYHFPPGLRKKKRARAEGVPQAVREIPWKAQSRLNQRYRALLRRGKLKNVAITAVAREFVAFIWAVAQAGGAAPAASKTPAPAAAREDGTPNGGMLILQPTNEGAPPRGRGRCKETPATPGT